MALSGYLARRALSFKLKELVSLQQIVHHSSGPNTPQLALDKIGTREIVGFGVNGQPYYFDKLDIPMPAIRFKEVTPDLKVLKEKEKGDWKKLSIEEKKALYRTSFCQTFAEIKAPTGEWKFIMGSVFLVVSLGVWLYISVKLFVYPPLPHTFSEEWQQATLQRMIDLRANPVDGIGSKYDYELGKWKE